jgi:hypothetical protein
VRLHRIQFTIRTLMIVVLFVACALALLQKWPEGLLVFVLLALPLAGLSLLFGKIPRRRSAWRFGLSVAMLSLIMLGTGWFSARSAIWFFQWQHGSLARGGVWSGGGYPEFCLTIAAIVTAFGLFLNTVVLADICVSHRRFGLLLLVAGFALALAIAWFTLFAILNSERFH